MKSRNRILWAALPAFLVCVVLSAKTGYSADFTFRVPVQMSNIPPAYPTGSVLCLLRDAAGVQVPNTYGSVPFNIVSGAFNGTIVVAFNLAPGIALNSVKNWQCELGVTNTAGTKLNVSNMPERDGTKPMVAVVRGALP
jgi:hypothetical protein